MRPKILLLDTIADEGMQALAEFAEITDGRSYSKETILQKIAQFDGLVIKSNNWITAEMMQRAVNLKVIGRAGSGTENIDLHAAAMHNIEVITSPEGNVCSVAEYALCMMLLLCHKLNEAHEGSRRNDFRRHAWQGRNLKNMTVGVIGMGHIGRGVITKVSALCKKILAYDPYANDAGGAIPVNFARVSSLEEIYEQADIISLHLPLTQETHRMLDRRAFSQIKKGCILINASRGQLIDDQALLEAFRNGTIEAAALDSLYPDPEYNKSPDETTYSHFLVNHPKVYYTPHIAAGTRDALRDVACNLANKMKQAFKNLAVINQ
jgi:D-3-phosphoglycerate dehydrogenase